MKSWKILAMSIAMLCTAVGVVFAQTALFNGTWDGTAGDSRVDEQWRISHVNGKWAVHGYYFWNQKGCGRRPS